MLKHVIAVVSALGIAGAAHQAGAQEKPVLVFAAASTKNALDDVNRLVVERAGNKVVASYAASSALARQIEQGAPADVFISADTDWMDYAEQHRLVRADSRIEMLGNRLVLVAPADAGIGSVTVGKDLDLSRLSGDGRIVTGDVRAVPVGKYAKEALQKLGLWSSVENKLAMTENVRAALTLVVRGEGALGIVYETDAKVEPQVKIVGMFPADSHPAIVYPVAATAAAKPEADRYIAFLRSQAAKTIFEKYGFAFLARPAS